jgi:hypothetical protein
MSDSAKFVFELVEHDPIASVQLLDTIGSMFKQMAKVLRQELPSKPVTDAGSPPPGPPEVAAAPEAAPRAAA